MECRLHLLALLLGVLAWAAAAARVSPCDPQAVVNSIAQFCHGPPVPTPECCSTVVAAFELRRFSCLCSAAAAASRSPLGINATEVLKTYETCTGSSAAHCKEAAASSPAPRSPPSTPAPPPPGISSPPPPSTPAPPPPPLSTPAPPPPPSATGPPRAPRFVIIVVISIVSVALFVAACLLGIRCWTGSWPWAKDNPVGEKARLIGMQAIYKQQ